MGRWFGLLSVVVLVTGGIGYVVGLWSGAAGVVVSGSEAEKAAVVDGGAGVSEGLVGIDFLDVAVAEGDVWGVVSGMSADELEGKLRELLAAGERADPALWLAGEAMAARLAVLDVERAWALGTGGGDVGVAGMVVRAAAGELVRGGEWGAVWARVIGEVPVRLRTAGVEGIVDSVGVGELGEVAAVCGRGFLLGRERGKLLERIYERWVEADVEGALGSLGEVKVARERRVREEMVGEAWARLDLEGALRRVEEGTLRGVADGVLGVLVNEDPWRAAGMLEDGGRMGRLLRGGGGLVSLGMALLRDDPERGWAWVMGLGEAGVRVRLMEQMGSDFEIGEDVVRTAAGLPDSKKKREMMGRMIEVLGRSEPEVALGILGEQPEGGESARARLDVYRSWAAEDAATAWEHAIGAGVAGGESLGVIFGVWKRASEVDAEAALEALGLPDDVEAEVRR